MLNQFSRTQLLLGKDNMDRLMNKLKNSRVAVFGIGGVGGYVAEALARSGVGSFVLVDDDKVCLTNLNRQIIATRKTVGKYKAEVMRDRILEINPDAEVEVRKCFYLPENADEFDFNEYSYVVDDYFGFLDDANNGEAGDHHAREGVRGTGHQQYGSRKQARSDQIPGS